jgi:hypothetical protein
VEQQRHAIGAEDGKHDFINLVEVDNKTNTYHLNSKEERCNDVCESLGAHQEGQHSESQRYNQIYKHGR